VCWSLHEKTTCLQTLDRIKRAPGRTSYPVVSLLACWSQRQLEIASFSVPFAAQASEVISGAPHY
jgi:hypothetical protein